MQCKEMVGENEAKEEHESESTQKKITTKSKTNPTPIFEEVLTRLDIQNYGTTTCLQEKTVLL